MKKEITKALNAVKRAALAGQETQVFCPRVGICTNMSDWLWRTYKSNRFMYQFNRDKFEIYETFPDWSGCCAYPLSEGSNLAGWYTMNAKWQGRELQKRLALIEHIKQYYKPVPRR